MRFKITVEIEVWQTPHGQGFSQPDEEAVVRNMECRAERYIAQETYASNSNAFWTGNGTVRVQRIL